MFRRKARSMTVETADVAAMRNTQLSRTSTTLKPALRRK